MADNPTKKYVSKVTLTGEFEPRYLKDADARALIESISSDYLDSTDKEELLGKISAEAKTRSDEDTSINAALAAEIATRITEDIEVLDNAKAYTDEKVGALVLLKYEIVESLPTADAVHEFNTCRTIYLKALEGTEHVYEEFICVKENIEYRWEQIGSTKIDLSNYYTKSETEALIKVEEDRALAAEAVLETALEAAEEKLDGIEDHAQVNKIEAVKLGGNFLDIKDDSEEHGPYVDLGNIATTEGVLQGVDYVTSARKLTKTSGSGTTSVVHVFGELADTDIADIKAAGQEISGVKATGITTGEITGELGTVATNLKSTGNVTALGDITIDEFTQTSTAATLTKSDYTPEGKISFSSEGSYSFLTGTVQTEGVLPTKAKDSFDRGTQASLSTSDIVYVESGVQVGIDEDDDECLVFTNVITKSAKAVNTFTANNLPTFTEGEFTQGSFPEYKSESRPNVTGATFTGTKAEQVLVTGVNYDKASPNGASFSGKPTPVEVNGSYDKATIGSLAFQGKDLTLDVDTIKVEDSDISHK